MLLAVLVANRKLRLSAVFFLEEINQDYVRTARAKGLPERSILLRKHRAAQRDDPDPDQRGTQLPGHLHRLVPDRGVFSILVWAAKSDGGEPVTTPVIQAITCIYRRSPW